MTSSMRAMRLSAVILTAAVGMSVVATRPGIRGIGRDQRRAGRCRISVKVGADARGEAISTVAVTRPGIGAKRPCRKWTVLTSLS